MATINYADPPDDLKCLICLEVAQDPMQHEACGKLFCKECIEQSGVENPCPNCRISESKFYMDNRSKQLVLEVALLWGLLWGNGFVRSI